MTRSTRTTALAALLLAGVLAAAGCGTDPAGCATETPEIRTLPSDCTSIAPETNVEVSFNICPTCNQIDPVCQLDLNQLADGIIHLDPIVHACDSSTSCPPSCAVADMKCTFKSPAAGRYSLYIGDNTTPVNFVVTDTGTRQTCG